MDAMTEYTLKGMHDLLLSPERWTQGEIARDANGTWCPPLSAHAKCWCLMGAFRKVRGIPESVHVDTHAEPAPVAIRRQMRATGMECGIVGLNDLYNHATVIGVIGGALETVRSKEAA